MLISVVIPAFNEERYLPETLRKLEAAILSCRCEVEVIVVENGCTDGTADVARSFGATVVREAVRNVARVRNAGARVARGEVLAFVDADTAVPPHFLDRVAEAMADPACMGGCVDIVHTPKSRLLQVYLAAWRWVGIRFRMAQGAAQFCRKAAFELVDGYDESQYMGEDVDFYWRMERVCRQTGGYLKFLDDVTVVPSPRRFDRTPIWRTLIWSNSAFVAMFRRRRSIWAEWYVGTPR